MAGLLAYSFGTFPYTKYKVVYRRKLMSFTVARQPVIFTRFPINSFRWWNETNLCSKNRCKGIIFPEKSKLIILAVKSVFFLFYFTIFAVDREQLYSNSKLFFPL